MAPPPLRKRRPVLTVPCRCRLAAALLVAPDESPGHGDSASSARPSCAAVHCAAGRSAMAGERGRLDAVQRAEAKRAAAIQAIKAQERALAAAGSEETPAAQARRNRLRVRLAQLQDTLTAAEQELGRLARRTT